MGSTYPLSTVSCDDKATILAFRPSPLQQLSMEELIVKDNAKDPLKVLYKQPGTARGIVSIPGSLASVKSRGLVTTYGVADLVDADKTVTKVLAQLSPVAMLLTNTDGESIATNADNLSITATCDGGSKVYIFTVEPEGSGFDIQQISINFQDGGIPQMTFAGAAQQPVQKSRVAAVTDIELSKRYVFYEAANKTIIACKYPEKTLEPVTQNYILPSTPLATTITKVDDKRILCLYFISGEGQALRRTTKELGKEGATWAAPVDVKSSSEGKKVSLASDLAVTTLGNVNWVFFIEDKNKSYGSPTPDTITV